MNLNKLTLKTQEALQAAQQNAFKNKHPQVENEHLFSGILEVEENVLPFVFNRLKVNLSRVKSLNENILNTFSKVEGSTQNLSKSASQSLINSINIAKITGDEYVIVEHLLISIFESKSKISNILKDKGINKVKLELAIEELRKGEKVTSVSA